MREGEMGRLSDWAMGRTKRWSDSEKGEGRDGEEEKEKKENPLQSVLAEASAFHPFTFQKSVLLLHDSN